MVHPTLTNDPVNMQGELGLISLIDTKKDEVYVRFKNQMHGLYSADALLMLVPGLEILDKLRADSEELERYDFIDILGIYLLDATGEEKFQRSALELAMSRSSLVFATIISVQDYIDLRRDLGDDLEQTRGR